MTLILGAASASLALPITQPTGLNPGDEYRLVFVTSTTRDATSTDIADYNTFVTGVANSVSELAALGTTWRAIGSTSVVTARDNTNTNPSSGTGLPIYLLDGATKIADSNADLWDGTIDAFLDVDENGLAAGATQVWTGSRSDGTVNLFLGTPRPLGVGAPDFNAARGFTGSTVAPWIGSTDVNPTSNLHALYAISGTLTAVPEPTTALLLGGGLLGLAVRGRRGKA